MSESGDSDLPLGRPAPDTPDAALLALPRVHVYSEPATRAGNCGLARASIPAADGDTAARPLEWLISRLKVCPTASGMHNALCTPSNTPATLDNVCKSALWVHNIEPLGQWE